MLEERISELEAMRALGCKKTKFYSLRKKHTFLQPVSVGRDRFFSKRDVEKVIELEKAAKARRWATPTYRRRNYSRKGTTR